MERTNYAIETLADTRRGFRQMQELQALNMLIMSETILALATALPDPLLKLAFLWLGFFEGGLGVIFFFKARKWQGG